MINAAQAGQDVVKLIGIGAAVWLYARAIMWAARKTAEAADAYLGDPELEIDYDKLLTATAEEVARERPDVKVFQMTPTWPTARDDHEAFHLDTEDNQPLAS